MSARRPKMWVKWRLRLPLDWRLDVRVLRHGRCTPDECGYGNVWCRNGCEEHFHVYLGEEPSA